MRIIELRVLRSVALGISLQVEKCNSVAMLCGRDVIQVTISRGETPVLPTLFLCVGVVDAPAGHVTLGASMANGIEQKGIDDLSTCIKKCSLAGLGIPATVGLLRYQDA